jgi:hypothetical protein
VMVVVMSTVVSDAGSLSTLAVARIVLIPMPCRTRISAIEISGEGAGCIDQYHLCVSRCTFMYLHTYEYHVIDSIYKVIPVT